MKLIISILLLPCTVSFMVPEPGRKLTRIQSEPKDMERMKEILIEESTNPENMKAAADMIKKLKPEELTSMIAELDSMPDSQFKAMGMDKNVMKQSLTMIQENPEMMASMGDMMSQMSPEEMLENSRRAQEQMKQFTATTPDTTIEVQSTTKSEKKKKKSTGPIIASAEDEGVISAMFNVAEVMSTPPTGGVTYQGFRSLPVMSLLVGTDAEEDLTEKEAKECWADGSLGATRVDQKGFQRVWDEVKEYFDEDIMEEARERAAKTGKRRGGAPASTAVTPTVGGAVAPEILEQEVKNMDIDAMLKAMKSMSPEEEARFKAMGVNPEMMKKTASIMDGNPLMRNAAKMMMKNMSADQMMKASQQAQQQMSKMSDADMKKMMSDLERNK